MAAAGLTAAVHTAAGGAGRVDGRGRTAWRREQRRATLRTLRCRLGECLGHEARRGTGGAAAPVGQGRGAQGGAQVCGLDQSVLVELQAGAVLLTRLAKLLMESERMVAAGAAARDAGSRSVMDAKVMKKVESAGLDAAAGVATPSPAGIVPQIGDTTVEVQTVKKWNESDAGTFTSVFVKNLPGDADEGQLRARFAGYGSIISASIL